MTTTRASLPDLEQRAELNRRLLATGTDTGIWDETGNPAPWPDDIDEWRPATSDALTAEPGQRPL